MRLDRLIENLKSFDNEIIHIIRKTLEEHQDVIIDMNVSQLYDKGITREGRQISHYDPYSQITIQIKSGIGQPTDRVTLRNEGDFHQSFYVVFLSDAFKIDATDWKTMKLKNRYGEEILGLTDDNFITLAIIIVKPEIIKHLKNIRA